MDEDNFTIEVEGCDPNLVESHKFVMAGGELTLITEETECSIERESSPELYAVVIKLAKVTGVING